MIDFLAFHSMLRKLQRKRERVFEDMSKLLLEEKGDEKYSSEELMERVWKETERIEEEISVLLTHRLTVLAQHYHIQTPPLFVSSSGMELNDGWVQSKFTHHYHLTKIAAANLRAEIRKEQREGSELFFRYLSGFTGFLGTVIGLLALVWHHQGCR